MLLICASTWVNVLLSGCLFFENAFWFRIQGSGGMYQGSGLGFRCSGLSVLCFGFIVYM